MSQQQTDHEPDVSLESIDSALDHLAKAAGATDVINKAGYQGTAVDQTGHVDERGQTAGGYPAQGDVGGLDDLMIGKMQEALVDAGFDANQIEAAFMQAKQEDDDEDEDEDEDDDAKMKGKKGKMGAAKKSEASPSEPGNQGGSEDPDLRKSKDDFLANQDVADAVDVSPFLEGLVERTADQIDGLAKSLREGHSRQGEVNKRMATALYGIGQLVKSQQSVIHELGKRLGSVERQPSPQRGHTDLAGSGAAQPLNKGLPNEAGGASAPEQLNKSELLNTLSYMHLEKGVKEIAGQKTSDVIAMYEGGGVLMPQALQAAQRFLTTHPNEAETARSYR